MEVSQDDSVLQFINCNILIDHNIIREDLWVRNGTIMNPERLFFEERRSADVQIDCAGVTIVPGFIDVQLNGGFGVDFTNENELISEGVKKVAKGVLYHGVTSFCPTVTTNPPEVFHKILPQFQRSEGSKEGAGVLGLHLEGPFLSEGKRGAHSLKYLKNFDNGFQDVLDMYGSLDNVSLVTIAPELNNAIDVIKEFTSRGIKVSLGHSEASLSQGEAACQAGASAITHLYNGMLPFHHRDPYLVGLLASENIPEGMTMYYSLISDGVHTHPAALRIAHRIYPKGLFLVTDAIPALGLTVGVHHIGEQKVEIKNNRALLADTDIIVGSIANMNECIKYFYESTECSMVEAIEAATLHPAEMLEITHRKGTLDYGTDADFVFLDGQLNVLATYIAGEPVWEEESQNRQKQIKYIKH